MLSWELSVQTGTFIFASSISLGISVSKCINGQKFLPLLSIFHTNWSYNFVFTAMCFHNNLNLLQSSDDLHERLRFLQNAIGPVPSPFDCYLLNRSLKTLAVRMEQHMKNGFAVARFLEGHPCVEKVIHPGLPSHPQHEVRVNMPCILKF